MFAKRTSSRVLVASLAVLAVTASLLVATASPSGRSAKVTLVLGNSQWLDRLRGAKMWEVMKQFEKVNPNVTLKQEAIPGPNISTVLTAQLGAGKGPDVMMIQDDLFYTFANAKWLVPIPASVTKGVPLNKTNAGAVWKGVRLGVGWQQAPFAIMYNKALFRKAGITHFPTTLPQFINAAKTITKKTGAVGFGDQNIAAGIGSWTFYIESWIYGNGGFWSKNGKLTINTPANVAGVAEFANVAKSGIMTESAGYNAVLPAFQQGHVAMMTDCCGAYATALVGVVPSKDIGFAPHPTPLKVGFAQQLYVAVNKNSKQQAAALEFVKWLLSPAAQRALTHVSGGDPVATDVPLSAADAAAYPWEMQLIKLGATDRALPIPGWEVQTGQIMQIITNQIQRVVVNGVTPAAALKAAAAEVASQVKK